MKDFYSLTVQGRARRLRTLALAALDQYDVAVTRLRLLSNDMNCVFRVDTADKGPIVLRVGRGGAIGHSVEETLSEVAWLEALANETDVATPAPIRSRSGEPLVLAGAGGVPDQRHCALFTWLPGRVLGDDMNASVFEALGALAARLHHHGAGFEPPEGFSAPVFDKVFPFDEPIVLFDDVELLPGERRAVFETAIDRVGFTIGALAESGESMHVLHGDLHPWNVLIHRGSVAAFDFEDLMLGWPVQDIATTLYYVQDRDDFGELRSAYRRGYEVVRPWPERIDGEVDTFIASRAVVLANDVPQLEEPEIKADAPMYFARFERRIRKFLDLGDA